MGFGTEILFMLMLGLLVLGPKRLHALGSNNEERIVRIRRLRLRSDSLRIPEQMEVECSISNADLMGYGPNFQTTSMFSMLRGTSNVSWNSSSTKSRNWCPWYCLG